MKRKSINITEELHTELKVIASKKKISLRELVELILKENV